ncbi:MAG: D-alanyl-D-alanine carboxypeptidase [Tistrella sp.]|jgi:D-alanyl-D-alanine carboxypeptidase (penicillin-binding protein 5/6)|uniref:serine-type D-Ala-D-Ala carboxypeptidase n=1 Tax=Tistrella mobilis TaxID=171437 RepID=A0A3B9IR46_9PROT|nr:D-alanyl-D-alanine carboxypeptidase family protein [Tistrella sp.]MAD35865.1 D-alanyl-D-alanine carboxypeptidase [Tistrella sp.]MBA78167.1 D-alanyl-D-alanine carboxypeptidase [Tistrella sp.]HAE49807.1 D-alanyl-D-alanine carboxypeptidase [Tistrella mobilis]
MTVIAQSLRNGTTFPRRRRDIRGVTARMSAGIALLASVLASGTALAAAPHFESAAKQAILLDDTTGAVLYAKNADERMAPSSMSKLMTAYILFERIKEGRVSMDDAFPVSERAWRMGGSKMFVEVNTRVKVQDLIQGIIVQSGNDACVVVAEGLAGSEEAFARLMNEKARELGMTGSHFMNASGWPDPEHYMTARDLSTLARRIIDDFPEFYKFYSETEYTYNGIKQGNRNPLLYKDIGVDGMKTGHTEAGGYGLTASMKQGDRRLIMVVNGLGNVNERSNEGERLLSWGMREFENRKLFSAGEVVESAEVWLGDQGTVPLVPARDLVVTLPVADRDNLAAKVVYEGPIQAPIAQGQEIAKLVVDVPGVEPLSVPLVAGQNVAEAGPVGRILAAISHFVSGAAGGGEPQTQQ